MLRSTSLLNKTKAPSSYYSLQTPTTGDLLFLRHGIPDQTITYLINELNSDQLSLLHYAAKNDNVEIIESLIGRGAGKFIFLDHIDITGLDNATPLHLGAKYNKLLAVQTLLGYDANVQAQDINLNTPLHYAAMAGHLKISSKGNTDLMEFLLTSREDKFINGEEQIASCNYSGASVLHRAVQCGQEKAIKFCLDKVTDISIQDKNGLTPLHTAAIIGEDAICQILLQKKPAVDAQDNYDRTPLHYAASLNHLKIVDMLLSAGANIDGRDYNQLTPFLCAVILNHFSTVQLLIDHNCQVDVVDKSGKNCYHLAVMYDQDLSLLKYILRNVDRSLINAVDEYERTATFYACKAGKTKVLQLLLDYDLDLNVIDEDGNNCLHFACNTYGIIYVHYFNRIYMQGITAIFNDYHIIIFLSREECVDTLKILLQYSPQLLCSEGENCCSPLHIAVAYGCIDNAEFLLAQGADINRR
ncbi:Ankyrin-3 [Trichoplax sp. H2]|nr:Ankyrin-3 [Trichoplax sp. H2]|eukprot:RDD38688.1 Ankyrin-3 [Trichoplax sp. H2]